MQKCKKKEQGTLVPYKNFFSLAICYRMLFLIKRIEIINSYYCFIYISYVGNGKTSCKGLNKKYLVL